MAQLWRHLLPESSHYTLLDLKKKKKRLDTSKHFWYTVSVFTKIKHSDQLLISVCIILKDPNIMRLLNSKHTYMNGDKIYDEVLNRTVLSNNFTT